MKKKIWKHIVTTVLIVGILSLCYTDMGQVKAEEEQDYSNDCWSAPIQAYLTATSDGYMRVQADGYDYSDYDDYDYDYGQVFGEGNTNTFSGYLVEYYDTSFKLQKKMVISEELTIFGGFYETEDNYYILSGQENPKESDNVEVFRITKYDKQWNRITSCGLYGANTYIPFDAGSARMAHSGNQLIIHTCHEMYKSSDGLNHQANVTIQVDTSSMTVVDARTGISNISTGYVSHSFNQFVEIEDNHIVTVDHGDAYPRSIVLVKYSSDISQESFTAKKKSNYNLLKFEGEVGDNDTGATVGGFAISDTCYIVAGTQENTVGKTWTNDIFVITQNKETNAITRTNITSNSNVRTPHLVSLGANCFLLLWSKDNTVYYTELNGNGSRTGAIYSVKGHLSDCEPIVRNGKVVWYTGKVEKAVTFYEIDANNLSQTNVVRLENGKRLLCKDGACYKITKNAKSGGTVQHCGMLNPSYKTVKIPDTVELGGVTYKVTSIAKEAFADNTTTKVTIGNNVTTIGKNAFYGCWALKTVTMGKKVTTIKEGAFNSCGSLKKIVIPSKVNKIEKNAFAYCGKLKNITIKTKKLTKSKVGRNAFWYIAEKATIKVPKKKLSSYKKILKAKGVSNKAKIKKS